MLDFLSDSKIVVAFDDDVISEQAPTLKPFGFHVLEVRVDSGDFGRKLSFPVLTDSSQAKVIKGGELLVLAGEELKKYSSDFEEIASRSTPLRLHGQPTRQVIGAKTYWNPHYESWQIDVAPGGATFTLSHIEEPMHLELQWLRAIDFSELQSVNTHTWKGVFAGDDDALLVDPLKTMVVSAGKQALICQGCSMAYLIADNMFFLDQDTYYEITTLSGKKLARGKLSVHASAFARAMNASRFAYSTGAYSGYGFPLKTHFPSVHIDVRVFDWKQMKQIAELSLEKRAGEVSAGFRQSAIALSPDGTLLAVLDDSHLSCYKVR